LRCLSWSVIASVAVLLLWISGGFPPKASLLLLQGISQFPYLFKIRGPQIVLSLVALAALSLTWLTFLCAFLCAGIVEVWHWGHYRQVQHDQRFSRIAWERTRSNHSGGTRHASTQFVNPTESFSGPSEYAKVETQRTSTSTPMKARKVQEMDTLVATTRNVGIGWDVGIERRTRPNEDSLAAQHSTCT